MSNKEMFIHSIKMIEFEGGETNIPSVLFYKDGKPLVGLDAIQEASENDKMADIEEDFKVEIGNIKPGLSSEREIAKRLKNRKDPIRMTSDFFQGVLRRVSDWLEINGIEKCESILIAEPLSMEDKSTGAGWISNYRSNVKRLLVGKGFKDIDFLPEPFAAFQYYRYGLKNPLLAEKSKNQVLVLDFGGGTFDSCVIETTKKGDIKQGGANSRPIAANSRPIGGFNINRSIARYVYNKYLENSKNRSDFNKGYKWYNKYKSGEADIAELDDKIINFIYSFEETVRRAECTKLALSRSVTNWDLKMNVGDISAPISIPENAFTKNGEFISVQVSASEFRYIFIQDVWNAELKGAINKTIKNAKRDLVGAPITIVLLSGGSANIGWIRKLLDRDFSKELSEAELLHLDDYQEVVSKGLAIESARRFYSDDGDFSATTYNRLCLVLDPDNTGNQLKNYKNLNQDGLRDSKVPGVLLPSASALKQYIGKELMWKVRLDRPPRNLLNYYFLCSSFVPEDTKSLQNVEENTLYTKKISSFDKFIGISLLVKKDGTAYPKFIYRKGRVPSEEVSVNGKPFYLDMTHGHIGDFSKAYIGYDFGTSNSSVSYVDQKSVEIFEKRNSERGWKCLNEVLGDLPYPLANPLAEFLSETHQKQSVKKAFKFIEAVLALGAYLAYVELCSKKTKINSKIFKGYTKRSAGPLWKLLKDSLAGLGRNAEFSSPLLELTKEHAKTVDEAINFFNEYKHDKADERSYDYLRFVNLMANVSHKLFRENYFGYFTNVKKQRFGSNYNGLFYVAHGNPPFVQPLEYIGSEAFSEDQPFIVNFANNKALCLQPLMFWNYCEKHFENNFGHIYIYDNFCDQGEYFEFMTVGYSCVCTVQDTDNYRELFGFLKTLKTADQKLPNYCLHGLHLQN